MKLVTQKMPIAVCMLFVLFAAIITNVKAQTTIEEIDQLVSSSPSKIIRSRSN